MYVATAFVLLFAFAQASILEEFNFELDNEGTSLFLAERYRRPDFSECENDEGSSLDTLRSLLLKHLPGKSNNLSADLDLETKGSINIQVGNKSVKLALDGKTAGNISLEHQRTGRGEHLSYKVHIGSSSDVKTPNGTVNVKQSVRSEGSVHISSHKSRHGCRKLLAIRAHSKSIRSQEVGKVSNKSTRKAEAKAVVAKGRHGGAVAKVRGSAITTNQHKNGNSTHEVVIRQHGGQIVLINKKH